MHDNVLSELNQTKSVCFSDLSGHRSLPQHLLSEPDVDGQRLDGLFSDEPLEEGHARDGGLLRPRPLQLHRHPGRSEPRRALALLQFR